MHRESRPQAQSQAQSQAQLQPQPQPRRRQKRRHANPSLWGAVEILPDRLYYAPLKFLPKPQSQVQLQPNQPQPNPAQPQPNQPQPQPQAQPNEKEIHYFGIDDELVYWNFFLDYGPLNLGQLHRFCSLLNAKLSSPPLADRVVCFHSGQAGERRSNAVVLICAWQMLYLGRTLEEAYWGFRDEDEDDQEEEEDEDEQQDEQQDEQKDELYRANCSWPPQKRSNRSNNRSEQPFSASASSSSSGSSGDESAPPSASPFAELHPLPPFHDASPIICTFDLTPYDVLCGLDKAIRHGFFRFADSVRRPVWVAASAPSSAIAPSPSHSAPSSTSTAPSPSHSAPSAPPPFDVRQYEHFEQVEHGDLNWIVQNKLLAFAGPHSRRLLTPDGFCVLSPSDLLPHFTRPDVNVKLVVRLNKKCYDESEFLRAGIRHVDHHYLDGSCPNMSVLRAVLWDMESVQPDEAAAVHCKAGLERTGMCIGAYLMKHFGLTAREAIGWMRLHRPGMVIGPRQRFWRMLRRSCGGRGRS
ncbi:hypothetical protein ACHAXS_004301 [Conticribra weissflogii]